MAVSEAALCGGLGEIAPPPGVALKYGTAGFRTRAELLDSTFLRMGVLAALRSRHQQGAAVGLMVTASHNPEQDNGIKMVDPDGGMLDMAWEAHAMAVANASTAEVMSAAAAVAAAEGVELVADGGQVFVAGDSRPHSERLAALARRGAALAGAAVSNLGLLTTPQLHHTVRMKNVQDGVSLGEATGLTPAHGADWAGEEGYYRMLATAFAALVSTAEAAEGVRPLCIDASCGVGAPKVTQAIAAVNAELDGAGLQVTVTNGIGEGALNEGCGAEFVQKQRRPPPSMEHTGHGTRLCSIDGDADRLVYHYFTEGGEWRLLDGDKIATLAADFIIGELQVLALADTFSTAIVQTAYANGASTAYLRTCQGLRLDFAKTGVKYVHHVATKYDIGVYFEANGHGTVLFKAHVIDHLRQLLVQEQGPSRRRVALERLLATQQIVNQAVGDAISDILFVEAILRVRGWGLEQWDALYTDLPSRQMKLPVADRSVVQCSPDETRALEPQGLQATLDEAMAAVSQGRCFVRPSGTEDVVRVYAEAANQTEADALAVAAAQAVFDFAGGIGDRPE